MTIIAIDECGTAFVGATMKEVIQEMYNCGYGDEIAGIASNITFYSATEKKLVYTPPKYELVATKTKSK